MSDTAAASWTVAITALLVGLTIYLTFRLIAEHIDRRDRRAYLQANWDQVNKRWADNDGHDVGPDALRLQQDLETHLKAYGESIADLYDTTTGE